MAQVCGGYCAETGLANWLPRKCCSCTYEAAAAAVSSSITYEHICSDKTFLRTARRVRGSGIPKGGRALRAGIGSRLPSV